MREPILGRDGWSGSRLGENKCRRFEKIFIETVGAGLGTLRQEQCRVDILKIIYIKKVGSLPLAGRCQWDSCGQLEKLSDTIPVESFHPTIDLVK